MKGLTMNRVWKRNKTLFFLIIGGFVLYYQLAVHTDLHPLDPSQHNTGPLDVKQTYNNQFKPGPNQHHIYQNQICRKYKMW